MIRYPDQDFYSDVNFRAGVVILYPKIQRKFGESEKFKLVYSLLQLGMISGTTRDPDKITKPSQSSFQGESVIGSHFGRQDEIGTSALISRLSKPDHHSGLVLRGGTQVIFFEPTNP